MRTLQSLRQPWMYSVLFGLAMALSACSAASQTTRATVTATATEPTFSAAMIGPLTKETPLQIVSLFSHEPGETLISPATELATLIADQRVGGSFGKEPLRTLMIDPSPGTIKAQRLLYIALGPRSAFSLARVRAVGAVAMREALRLGVPAMAFAPVVRDQGVTTFGADEVAAAFVEGALAEWDTAHREHPVAPLALQEVVYEAGPAFIDSVKAAIPRAMTAAHARRQTTSQ